MAAGFKALPLASECLGGCVAIVERDVRFRGNRVVQLGESRRMRPATLAVLRKNQGLNRRKVPGLCRMLLPLVASDLFPSWFGLSCQGPWRAVSAGCIY